VKQRSSTCASLEIRARDLRMLDRREDNAPALAGAAAGASTNVGDLPF